MIRDFKFLIPVFVIGLLFLKSPCLYAQGIDDIMVNYSMMNITEAKVGNQVKKPVFYRHNIQLQLGLGQAIVGLIYQYATKDNKTVPGKTEDGVMLTAGYDLILSERFRLDAYGRLGVSSDTNPAQPLYTTDTDIRLNLIWFHPDGVGLISQKAIFPSSYFGMIVNKYGRVQGIAGVGLWWNGIGTYLTGFKAFNGCEDPFNPGKDSDKVFANLKNSALNLSLSYEFHNFKIELRKNFPIQNSGNDLTLSAQYQYFFRRWR